MERFVAIDGAMGHVVNKLVGRETIRFSFSETDLRYMAGDPLAEVVKGIGQVSRAIGRLARRIFTALIAY
jgi:hypothetical protein